MITRAAITFEDADRHQATICLECPDLTTARAMAEWCDDHSDAAVVALAFIQEEDFAGIRRSGAYDGVEQHNKLLFRNTDTGAIVTFLLPAPGEHTLAADQAAAEGFVAIVKTHLARWLDQPLLFLNGGLTSRTL